MKKGVINVYDLPRVENVCQQDLREAIRHPKFSMAHVTMGRGNESLAHKHKRMKEVYFMIKGSGNLYYDDKIRRMRKGESLFLDHSAIHKFRNIGNGELEHLVFALPPFDSEDVVLVKEKDWEKGKTIDIYSSERELFSARDGALVYELDSEDERKLTGVGIAAGFLDENRKALPHYHKVSEEFYYIVAGEGNVYLDEEKIPIKPGDIISVSVGVEHGLENTSAKEKLEVVCVTSPPYSDDDFYS